LYNDTFCPLVLKMKQIRTIKKKKSRFKFNAKTVKMIKLNNIFEN